MISEFVSLSRGLPLLSSILDEAALPSVMSRQRIAAQSRVGFLLAAFQAAPFPRSRLEAYKPHQQGDTPND